MINQTYSTALVRALDRLGKNGTTNPDGDGEGKTNVSPTLGRLFMWQEVKKYAEKRYEGVLTTAIIECGTDPGNLKPGQHMLSESPSFIFSAEISEPVRRFSEDELVKLLSESKYKVPAYATRELIAKAKVPGKSRVIKRVVER